MCQTEVWLAMRTGGLSLIKGMENENGKGMDNYSPHIFIRYRFLCEIINFLPVGIELLPHLNSIMPSSARILCRLVLIP